jgi:hypothetical protein
MRRHETRLTRLEAQFIRSVVEPIALAYGIDPDALIAEARQFLVMSDAEVDARLAAEIAQAKAEGNAEHVRILTEGWAELKSYRTSPA